jgi:hypothetical protein
MRMIKEIPHDKYKISIFSWNNKYIIKLEYGQLEQTYKVSEWDLTSEDEVAEIVNLLIENIGDDIFSQMNSNLSNALDKI